MKNILILFLILSAVNLTAQTAKKIISPAIKMESNDWYNEQIKLWKAKVDAKPTVEDNWYNYYRACNYSKDCGREELIKISEEAKKAVPKSFVYYYMMEKLDGFNSPYLDSAYMANPNVPDIWEGLLVRAISNNDKANMVYFSEKLLNSDEEDVNLYHWAYNMLHSLEKNAILFTHGDNDTFGAWILQGAKDERSDVDVLNTSLMMDSTYLTRYWREYFPKEETPNLQKFYRENDVEWDNGHAYTRYLMKKIAETGRPVHITVGTPEFFRSDFGDDNLFLTGLTFRYDPEQKFSSIAALIKNFEQVYKLDYIDQRFFSNIWDEKAKYMNKTYLTGLIKLYVHYQMTENESRIKWCEHLIKTIETDPNILSSFGDFIESETGSKPIEFNGLYVNSRKYLKKYKEIETNLFASSYEESNSEYRLFLEDLKKNDQENYKKHRPDSTLWTKYYPQAFNEPMKNMYAWHPAYDGYPVVNISKESAQAYCNWLTMQYNNDPKRKYQKVEFLLPTEAEWQLSAGELSSVKNENECYLVNGKEKGKYYDDGGFHMVKVDSYIENNNGLYCTYGNVSEVISDKNYSKGGGWATEYTELNSKGKFEAAPHPAVGFRVFMKIIQK